MSGSSFISTGTAAGIVSTFAPNKFCAPFVKLPTPLSIDSETVLPGPVCNNPETAACFKAPLRASSVSIPRALSTAKLPAACAIILCVVDSESMPPI